MPVSAIVRALGVPMTSQQLADFAKLEWESWRRALAAGDHDKALEHWREFEALCAEFQRQP